LSRVEQFGQAADDPRYARRFNQNGNVRPPSELIKLTPSVEDEGQTTLGQAIRNDRLCSVEDSREQFRVFDVLRAEQYATACFLERTLEIKKDRELILDHEDRLPYKIIVCHGTLSARGQAQTPEAHDQWTAI
jgi:hypothetical protein